MERSYAKFVSEKSSAESQFSVPPLAAIPDFKNWSTVKLLEPVVDMVAEVTSSTGVQHFELKTKEGWIVFLDARSKAYNEETRREVALIQVTVTCPGDPAGPGVSQPAACFGDPAGPVDEWPK